VAAQLAPNVEWEYGINSTDVPWLQPRQGREHVAAFFQSLAALDIHKFEPKTFLESGDVVGAQAGTTGAIWIEENLVPNGIEIQTFQSATDGLRALEGGGMAAFVAGEPFVGAATEDLPSLAVVQGIDTHEKYGLAFSPENPELRDAVNAALAEIVADGTYAEIYGVWFPGAPIPPEYQPAG